ncbi:Phosphoglucomutase [Halomonas sp. R57-5]|uniref:hypothetical protein n=1 Tax=Halomonas sp. R57-5 TaxID=1610576 RepID=UPI0005FC4560|nr:Phosphoglucomutase [Halomonas sp. R57-5]
MIEKGHSYTATPLVSHAIFQHIAQQRQAMPAMKADGLIITPSHNPPEDGGIKYNPLPRWPR